MDTGLIERYFLSFKELTTSMGFPLSPSGTDVVRWRRLTGFGLVRLCCSLHSYDTGSLIHRRWSYCTPLQAQNHCNVLYTRNETLRDGERKPNWTPDGLISCCSLIYMCIIEEADSEEDWNMGLHRTLVKVSRNWNHGFVSFQLETAHPLFVKFGFLVLLFPET